MTGKCKIGNRWVGGEETVFLAANIGVNHNGEIALARRLVEAAAYAGCDAVVLQKCVPERHIPRPLLNRIFATPWGDISYLEYRHRMELGWLEFKLLSGLCRELEICWAVTVRDIPSVNALVDLRPDYFRLPAAALADTALLAHLRSQEIPVMLCARPHTPPQALQNAVEILGRQNLVLIQGDSDRPAPRPPFPIPALEPHLGGWACPLGVANGGCHFADTLAAIALGASVLERPVTLHRSLWGGNQASSIEPWELQRLTSQVRAVELELRRLRQKEHGRLWMQQTLQAYGALTPPSEQAANPPASGARMQVGWKRPVSFRLSVHFKQPVCAQWLANSHATPHVCASGRFPGVREKWRQKRNPSVSEILNQSFALPPNQACGNEDK